VESESGADSVVVGRVIREKSKERGEKSEERGEGLI
jgi:hypothetical protein